MRFELVHRLDGTRIPFDMSNGKVTSDVPLPVSPEKIVQQYRIGLLNGCTKMFVGRCWEFKM